MAHIHLMQYLCPSRHAIVATCYDPETTTAAMIEAGARDAIRELGLELRCGICGSAELRFEHAPTRFTDLKSAQRMATAIMVQNLLARMRVERLRWAAGKN